MEKDKLGSNKKKDHKTKDKLDDKLNTGRRRRSFWEVIRTHTFLVLCLGVTVLLLAVFGQPSEQGFFCSDTSIRYPYKDSTVSTGLLAAISLTLPNIIIFLCEFCKLMYGGRSTSDKNRSYSKPPGRFMFLILLIKSFGTISLFWLGIGFAQVTVHAAKFLCGRLRPHFIAVCLPSVDCSLEENRYNFITNYTCLGTDVSLIKAARASFPSAHSAVAFYAAVYTIAYLHRVRISIKGSRFPGYFLQFLIFQAAWYTSLTRVLDNMHHWTDVLAGTIIGVMFALLIINYVEPPKPRLDPEIIEELRRANALPAELYTNGEFDEGSTITQQSPLVSTPGDGNEAPTSDRGIANV
uniref:Phosphatidate phosphatase n=1 Tax=Cacopsylla melanoneura TaxID=428564 RepID=A0A8D8QLP8_9HEMI